MIKKLLLFERKRGFNIALTMKRNHLKILTRHFNINSTQKMEGQRRPITIAEMRDWENATWAAGIEEEPVMRKAGKAVADCVLSLTQDADEVLVVAGKGKNGGDALYAAEYMPKRDVKILNVVNTDQDEAIGIIKDFKGAALIDGLFGIGLNRPVTGHYESLVKAINENQ